MTRAAIAPTAFLLLLALLPGCTEFGCEEDETVQVASWEGTPGMGVTWEEMGDVSFPHVEDLLDQASLLGGANGTVPHREFEAFEAALDQVWEDSGRPGSRPRQGDQNVVRYEAKEWNVTGSRVCA